MVWRYEEGTNNHLDKAYKEDDEVDNHRMKNGVLEVLIEVPSYINKKMNKLLKAGRFCHVIPADEVLFKVKDTNRSYTVNN
ncbi:hypothetical protein WN943_029536 [Citrus x changshan-huyou]